MTDRLSMWVIYDHPTDYPNHFIAREWLVRDGPAPDVKIIEPSPVTVYRDEYLENVRRFIQAVAPDSIRLERSDDDDPVIIESWV